MIDDISSRGASFLSTDPVLPLAHTRTHTHTHTRTRSHHSQRRAAFERRLGLGRVRAIVLVHALVEQPIALAAQGGLGADARRDNKITIKREKYELKTLFLRI